MQLPDTRAVCEQTKTFTFDAVFGPETQQADVYNETARVIIYGVIIDAVLEGYNGEFSPTSQ